jgi:hypothetical protein
VPDDTLSAAIREAYASAPADEVIYQTIELYHPDLSVPVRVVHDTADLDATLETTAPRNAGETVTFTGFAFRYLKPETGPNGNPQCTLEIDNVSREVVGAIESTMGSRTPITIIAREYLASDLTGPANDPPLELTVSAITVDLLRVRAVAGFADLTNRRFPRDEYTADRFPGLVL